MSWLTDLLHKINNYDNVVSENNSLRNKIVDEQTANKLLVEQMAILSEELDEVRDELEEALEPEEDLGTELDQYCQSKGYELRQIAYQNKRSILGNPVSVYLHEMIQTNSYELRKFAKTIKDYTVKGVGTKVSEYLTWKSDEQFDNKDYYLYPNETIVLKECDCEDHSYLCSSLMPETLGVAYGFVNRPDSTSFAHAFNVFIKDGDLWLLDTVENYAIIKKVSRHYYSINYIVTQRGTYVVDGSVNFGMIAR